MKESPFHQKVRDNMAAGIICSQSLIGDDKRPIAEIIDADASILRHLKVSPKTIVEYLYEFLHAGRKGLGGFIRYKDHFEVATNSVRGQLRCPFGDRGMLGKETARVVNLRLNKQFIDFSLLNIHLIEKHGFFQGKGAAFRLEPAEVVKILEINR